MNFGKGWRRTVGKVFGRKEMIIQRTTVGTTFVLSTFLAGWILSVARGIGEPWLSCLILTCIVGVIGLTALAVSITEEGKE